VAGSFADDDIARVRHSLAAASSLPPPTSSGNKLQPSGETSEVNRVLKSESRGGNDCDDCKDPIAFAICADFSYAKQRSFEKHEGIKVNNPPLLLNHYNSRVGLHPPSPPVREFCECGRYAFASVDDFIANYNYFNE
jgi:hypothetical protein